MSNLIRIDSARMIINLDQLVAAEWTDSKTLQLVMTPSWGPIEDVPAGPHYITLTDKGEMAEATSLWSYLCDVSGRIEVLANEPEDSSAS